MAVPVNSVVPAITGTVSVGSTLTLSNGTWDTAISYAYAWLRDGVAITGATANTYTIQVADVAAALKGRVIASNVDGASLPAESLATIAVPSTLIVEDGTEIANADCYITLANADIYHAKYGNTNWSSLTAGAKEAALRKATAYMSQAYRQLWKGYRKTATQSLDWPRSFVYLEPFVHGAVGAYPYLVADNIVPVEVKNACCELALRASTEDLNPDSTQNVKKEQIGSISVEYDAYSPQGKRYDSINGILRPYLNSMGGASVQLVK